MMNTFVNFSEKTISTKSFLCIFLFLLIGMGIGFADDVGISKARLIQKDDRSYVLEVDINQQFLYTIKAPIFSGSLSGIRA